MVTGVTWDFECPKCGAEWNNDGDPIPEGVYIDEECPECEVKLKISANHSVDYDVELDESKTEARKETEGGEGK